MKRKKIASYLVDTISKSLGKITFTVATLLCTNLPAQAVSFNLTYGDGVNQSQYVKAAEAAALYWEDRLTDDVTINIHLDISDADTLPSGVLGGALPAFVNDVSYYDFQNALNNDRSSTYDNTAVANLPQVSNSSWRALYEDTWQTHDKINLTRANAKALGLINKHNSDLDGVIVLSDLRNVSYIWERVRTQTVESHEFDYISVLIHEIGHILGFVSAIDSINANNINDHQNKLNYVTPFNLFTNSNYTSNKTGSNVTYGEDIFFSIDGGQTNLVDLSTGEDTNLGTYGKGNGFQASHTLPNIYSIMNPTLAPGDRVDVTNIDLKMFDVLGWDIKEIDEDDTSYLSDSDIVNQINANFTSFVNTNNNYEIEKMLNQSRWGGGSGGGSGGGGGFGQNMDLARYLTQEGLFQEGTFWSKIPVEAASVPEPTSIMGLFGFGLLGLGLRRKRKSN